MVTHKTTNMNIKLINYISVIIPVTVLILFQIKLPGDFSYLPHIYAPINGIVAILLISSIIAVKKGNIFLHKTLIRISIGLSIIFLIMYILYHGTTHETKFPAKGFIKYLYYFILSTHILLSVFAIPLVLRAYFYASSGDFKRHRKIAKFAFPVWIYVAITGVIVYLIISPYYPN